MILKLSVVLLLAVPCGSRRIYGQHMQHPLQNRGLAHALSTAYQGRSDFLSGSHDRVSETDQINVRSQQNFRVSGPRKSLRTGQMRFASSADSSGSSGLSRATTKNGIVARLKSPMDSDPISSSKAAEDLEAVESKNVVPLQYAFQQRYIRFFPPRLTVEEYPFQAYTLSGGIFESAFEGSITKY